MGEDPPKVPEWDSKMPMAQNEEGKWVPDIPPPYRELFGLRKLCPWQPRKDCGYYFFTLGGYRAHYALRHILKLGKKPETIV